MKNETKARIKRVAIASAGTVSVVANAYSMRITMNALKNICRDSQISSGKKLAVCLAIEAIGLTTSLVASNAIVDKTVEAVYNVEDNY